VARSCPDGTRSSREDSGNPLACRTHQRARSLHADDRKDLRPTLAIAQLLFASCAQAPSRPEGRALIFATRSERSDEP
jgi:hypothetical protein